MTKVFLVIVAMSVSQCGSGAIKKETHKVLMPNWETCMRSANASKLDSAFDGPSLAITCVMGD